MIPMTRRHNLMLAAAAAAAILALLLPAAASARLTELGLDAQGTLGTPSCPSSPCLAVTRTTGFQLLLGGRRNPFIAPRDGRVVAFTLRLGRPTAAQIKFFDQQSGGKAQARIAILRPMPAQRRGQFLYRLGAQSDTFPLDKYFGTTVQFPLYTSLLVKKGWAIALSIPTWAPALAVNGLDNTFAWRSSRVKPCSDNPERQPPHTTPGSTREYFCTYRPARLTYSTTLISTP
ncbi:MAG: hypothetical protein QOI91_629 [Solirubrobacteraceae bacterium]|jgi:hypothetical protein|nr:hypothetical protein [Solirubrobacteraceae bacterium]